MIRRDQILDAAFALFSTAGVRATTIATVAERAGLSEPGLLHHFPSKDDLLLAVLARADASFPDVEAWMSAPGGGVESLRRLPASAQVLADRPGLTRLRTIVSAEAVIDDGAARRYVRERTTTVRHLLTRCIAQGVHRGELRSDVDPKACASEVIAFMEGIQVQWLLAPDDIDLVAAYETYVQGLVARLTPPSR